MLKKSTGLRDIFVGAQKKIEGCLAGASFAHMTTCDIILHHEKGIMLYAFHINKPF